jgi:hypothetical protein
MNCDICNSNINPDYWCDSVIYNCIYCKFQICYNLRNKLNVSMLITKNEIDYILTYKGEFKINYKVITVVKENIYNLSIKEHYIYLNKLIENAYFV